MSNCQLYERMYDYVHKHLTKPRVNIVKMEYALELRTGKQLYELMPSVAKVIPQMLAKHNSTVVRCGHNDTEDHYYDDEKRGDGDIGEEIELLQTWKQHTRR